MAVEAVSSMIGYSLYPSAGFDSRPALTLIAGGLDEPEALSTRDLLTRSFEARETLRYTPHLAEEDPAMAGIRNEVGTWIEDNFPGYDQPGTLEEYRTYTRAKFDALGKFLARPANMRHRALFRHINGYEFHASEAFFDASQALWGGGDGTRFEDSSCAFIAPTRASSEDDFWAELYEFMPLLRYVPEDKRPFMMRGVGPFVADTYARDPNGRQGYLMCAPVTQDMKNDLGSVSMGTMMRASQEAVHDTVRIASEVLGAPVVGLGAILPGVTRLGESIRKEFGDKVIATTGHGLTARIGIDIIKQHGERYREDDKPFTTGVIGAGSIGSAAAGLMAGEFEAPIPVFDTDRVKAERLATKYPGRFIVCDSAAEVVRRSNAVFSAVTKPVSSEGMTVEDKTRRVLIVEDSQPPKVNPEEWGDWADVAWVVGQDRNGVTRRTSYNYGDTLALPSDEFTCALETHGLGRYYSDLIAEGRTPERAKAIVGRLAVHGEVTARKAHMVGLLAERYGYGPARLQAAGKLIELSI